MKQIVNGIKEFRSHQISVRLPSFVFQTAMVPQPFRSLNSEEIRKNKLEKKSN